MESRTATMTSDAKQAFHALLERHRGILFKVANTYGHHPADREDLAQEIAVQLWRAFPGYDHERPFTTRMYRIALNVAISFVRSKTHRDRHAVPLDEELHDLSAPRLLGIACRSRNTGATGLFATGVIVHALASSPPSPPRSRWVWSEASTMPHPC